VALLPGHDWHGAAQLTPQDAAGHLDVRALGDEHIHIAEYRVRLDDDLGRSAPDPAPDMTGGQGIVITGSVAGRSRDGRLLAWGVAGLTAQAAFMAGSLIAETWQCPRYSPITTPSVTCRPPQRRTPGFPSPAWLGPSEWGHLEAP